MPSAMGAVGTDACPGKKGSWRAAGVGQQGLGTVQAAGGHCPLHQTYVTSCAPPPGASGCRDDGVPVEQSRVGLWGGSEGTLGAS